MTLGVTNTEAWNGCKVSMGWSGGSDPISRFIQRSDKVLYEGTVYNSKYNHVFWHFDWASAPSIVYESHKGAGVQLTPWEHVIDSSKVVSHTLHPMDLTSEQAHMLYLECTKLHGKPYDIRHLVSLKIWLSVYRKMGIRITDGKVSKFLRRRLNAGKNSKFICNELVFRTGTAIGLDMGKGLCNEITSSPEMLHLAHTGNPSALGDVTV